MFEQNSKFPRFFIFILLALAIIIFIDSFISLNFTGCTFLFALIVSAVVFMMDKHFKFHLTNYKALFFLFDLISLIGTTTVLVYSYELYSDWLSGLMISLCVILFANILVDILFFKNKKASKRECLLVNFLKLLSMLSVIVYFFGVAVIWFVILTNLIEILSLLLKLLMPKFASNLIENSQEEPQSELEKLITETTDDDGEVE